MRVHPGIGSSKAGTRCRTLIGGVGMPGLRDLDFGRQVLGYLEQLDWPDEVLVEDLSCSAHLALHRLKELRPAQVVLIGTASRGIDPPGTVRRYRLDLTSPSPEQVHQGVTETLGGTTSLDHTLAVVRHWGGFPSDTIVIEVEPLDCSFGPGFSEELGECIEPIVAMVREELGGAQGTDGPPMDLSLEESASPSLRAPAIVDAGSEEPSSELVAMAQYARDHQRLRLLEPFRKMPAVTKLELPSNVELAVRDQPWGVGLGAGGAWFEVMPLAGGKVALVIGDVVGRGTQAVATMSELRTAARAYTVLNDESPALLVSRLDRLVEATGVGQLTALTALVLAPDTGEICLATASQCPPLLLARDGTAAFVDEGSSPLLGVAHEGERPEGTARLAAGSTLLLFNRRLLQTTTRTLGAGMERLREAAAGAPRPLEDLCDHVLASCVAGVQRDDDVLLLALRVHEPQEAPRRDGNNVDRRSVPVAPHRSRRAA